MAHSLRVAVTQVEPEWFDLKGTVKKTCDLIAEAAANGARLIAFPECWVPGYPGWIWARPLDVELNTKYIYNSLSLGSPEFETIQAAAKQHSIAVVLGFSERAPSGSLYIAQAIISPAGEVLMHRRKLKPTHAERTVFGDGGGGDLANVVDVDFGGAIGSVRVGALACWEHTQPLLKYHTLSLRETVHVAMWPPLDPHGGVEHPGAIESGAFVLHCTAVCTEKGREAMRTHDGILFHTPGGGHSCVLGPDGRRLTQALHEGDPAKEGIVYSDLDLSKTVANKAFMDNVGHYSRPDLLWLGVDQRHKEHISYLEATDV